MGLISPNLPMPKTKSPEKEVGVVLKLFQNISESKVVQKMAVIHIIVQCFELLRDLVPASTDDKTFGLHTDTFKRFKVSYVGNKYMQQTNFTVKLISAGTCKRTQNFGTFIHTFVYKFIDFYKTCLKQKTMSFEEYVHVFANVRLLFDHLRENTDYFTCVLKNKHTKELCGVSTWDIENVEQYKAEGNEEYRRYKDSLTPPVTEPQSQVAAPPPQD